MKTNRFTLFFLVILMVATLFTTGCGALAGGDAEATPIPATVEVEDCKDDPSDAYPGYVCNPMTGKWKEAEAPTKEPTASPPPVITSTAVPPTATATQQNSQWHRITIAKYFETFGREKWELPYGTWFATDTSGGRYTAIESAPTGPQADGSDAGWCKSNQYGCPPHTFLYNVEVLSGTNAIMDIPTRLVMDSSNDGGLHLQLRFNDETRTPSELMNDYDDAASMGDLGLFIAIKNSSMQPATLKYLGGEFQIGYACWDCLSHTAGQLEDIVSLDDVSHFGQSTASQGDSFYPGYVIPIPSPNENPDFKIDLKVLFPEGTEIVIWIGRYDVEE